MAKLLLRHVYKIYPGVGKAKKNAKGEAKKRSGDFLAVKVIGIDIFAFRLVILKLTVLIPIYKRA